MSKGRGGIIKPSLKAFASIVNAGHLLLYKLLNRNNGGHPEVLFLAPAGSERLGNVLQTGSSALAVAALAIPFISPVRQRLRDIDPEIYPPVSQIPDTFRIGSSDPQQESFLPFILTLLAVLAAVFIGHFLYSLAAQLLEKTLKKMGLSLGLLSRERRGDEKITVYYYKNREGGIEVLEDSTQQMGSVRRTRSRDPSLLLQSLYLTLTVLGMAILFLGYFFLSSHPALHFLADRNIELFNRVRDNLIILMDKVLLITTLPYSFGVLYRFIAGAASLLKWLFTNLIYSNQDLKFDIALLLITMALSFVLQFISAVLRRKGRRSIPFFTRSIIPFPFMVMLMMALVLTVLHFILIYFGLYHSVVGKVLLRGEQLISDKINAIKEMKKAMEAKAKVNLNL